MRAQSNDTGATSFDVLLVLPSGVTCSLPAPLEDVRIDAAVAWYVQMFLEEATSWRTPEELLDLLAAVKGSRRFQGFGALYERSKSVDAETLVPDRAKKLGKVSGGSGKGGRRTPPACDHCGATMRYVGKARSQDEAEAWLAGAPLAIGNKCSDGRDLATATQGEKA